MGVLDGIEPIAVFRHFERVSAIPRASGSEKAAADYCAGYAESIGLATERDALNNVLIKKPGKGNRRILLQGHLDMVCEKNEGNPHDFDNEPLSLRVDGDYIRAVDTTLGADNAIGVAMALALMEESAAMPPLSVLLTTNEETGLEGAAAVSRDWLDAGFLINLDTEEDDVFVAGCAGGAKPRVLIPITRESVGRDASVYRANVFGLMGGHSGTDIEKGRANACVILGRVLERLLAVQGVSIISINGGMRDNAIPREGEVVFAAPREKGYALFELIGGLSLSLKREYRDSDPGVCVALSAFDEPYKFAGDEAAPRAAGQAPFAALTRESAERVAAAINLMPCGVMENSMSLNIVETSNNLGQVSVGEANIALLCAVRSSVATRLDWVLEKIARLAQSLGGDVTVSGAYPGWEYCPDSRLLKIAKERYNAFYGKEARVSAIHAGLECGLLLQKNPGLDAISMGPEILGAHTPSERASIQSVKNTYALLKDILARLV